MQCVLAAIFAEFLQPQFFLDFLLIAIRVIVDLFANVALEFHKIVLRHKRYMRY